MPDKDDVLQSIELFVRNSIFIEAYDNLGDLYNKGDKESAFELMGSVADKLNSFHIKNRYYDKIFDGFHKRNADRVVASSTTYAGHKIPFLIDEINDIMRGGIDRGDTFLVLAQSGVGKTKFLRQCGVYAARRGYKVLHIQAEGTREECLEGYDATWTGVHLSDIEVGDLDADTMKKIEKATANITTNGGEIFVETFEQFNTATMADVREIALEVIKTYGQIDIILLDYLELLDPGDGKKYRISEERHRREALANKFKNICVELNVAGLTATQASTVAPDLLDNPDFVQTRYNISEFKGIIKPFSYFMTMNQTKDEKAAGVMRLYMDKVRKYKSQQTIQICTNYNRERFYDRKMTLNNFYHEHAA